MIQQNGSGTEVHIDEVIEVLLGYWRIQHHSKTLLTLLLKIAWPNALRPENRGGGEVDLSTL